MKKLTILLEPNINSCNCQKLLYLPQNSLLNLIQTVVPVKNNCLFDELNIVLNKSIIKYSSYEQIIIFITITDFLKLDIYKSLNKSIYYRNHAGIKTKEYSFLSTSDSIESFHILITECYSIFQLNQNHTTYFQPFKQLFINKMGLNNPLNNDFDKYINPIYTYHINAMNNFISCNKNLKDKNLLFVPYLELFKNKWKIDIVI